MIQTATADLPDGHDGVERLRSILRSLRLKAMADDLPSLIDESARDQWGQLELLAELFGREEARRTQRRFERNLKASGLTEVYGLDHFNFGIARDHELDEGLVRDLAQCEFVRAHRNVIIAGGIGTGKTFLARTLGVEALKRGYKVFSYNTAALLEELYRKRNSFQFGKIYARVRNAPVLLLDDLAYLSYSPEKIEYLFSLIVDRYELQCGSTIVTSNTNVEDWWQFFPSKAMGLAFSDRILDGAQGIKLTGESIRKMRTKKKRRSKKKGEEK